MQKFVSKYALAAHLGVLTVAPLLLFPFFDQTTIGVAWLWLSLYVAAWIVMEPSRIGMEYPHEARARVVRSIVRDPFVWFMVFVVMWAAVRAFNGGVGMWYDAEIRRWSFKSATVDWLPGGVDGSGFFPFCAAVAMTVVATGIRNALGKAARYAFLCTVCALAGFAGHVLAVEFLCGDKTVSRIAQCSLQSPFYIGPAFGVALLCGIAGLFGAAEKRWTRTEFIVAAGLAGAMCGMLMFSTLVATLAFLVAALVMITVGYFLNRNVFEGAASLRCGVFFIAMTVFGGLFVASADAGSGVADRLEAAQKLELLSPEYVVARPPLSRIAFAAFKDNLWLGTGLGSYPVDVRFRAEASDYNSIMPGQAGALNGYLHLVAERGVLGAGICFVALGFLVWGFVSRLMSSFGKFEFRAAHILFPVVFVVAAALMFVECSWLKSDAMAVLLGALAVSAAAIPANRRDTKAGGETQNG